LQLSARETGLKKPSVANASQIITLDRSVLDKRAGKIPRPRFEAVLSGMNVVLGRRPG
jgi:mRNA-degrading endonuclease toxin of MazEF toxin-antitoxin module